MFHSPIVPYPKTFPYPWESIYLLEVLYLPRLSTVPDPLPFCYSFICPSNSLDVPLPVFSHSLLPRRPLSISLLWISRSKPRRNLVSPEYHWRKRMSSITENGLCRTRLKNVTDVSWFFGNTSTTRPSCVDTKLSTDSRYRGTYCPLELQPFPTHPHPLQTTSQCLTVSTILERTVNRVTKKGIIPTLLSESSTLRNGFQ